MPTMELLFHSVGKGSDFEKRISDLMKFTFQWKLNKSIRIRVSYLQQKGNERKLNYRSFNKTEVCLLHKKESQKGERLQK